MSLNVCSKLSGITNQETVQLDLPETTFNTPVQEIRQMITSKLGLSCEVDLIAFGKVLKDDKPLSFYGIKGTTTIYVINKRNISHITCISSESIAAAKAANQKLDSHGIPRMIVALRTALRSSEFKAVLERLNQKENRENLMAVTPGLREDPIVMAILQDAELLSMCIEESNITKVLVEHPVLAVAAENLAATWHEENPGSNLFSTGEQLRYGLDDSDDDDDDDTPAAAPASAEVSRLVREALLQANRTSANPATRAVPQSSNPGPSSGPAPITSAMLSQALSATRQVTTQPVPQAPAPAPARTWVRELQQMREMGITDEALCIQVLEATNGDVMSAINIIFSQQ